MNKSSWIAALACLNLGLLAGVVLYSLPANTAFAQETPAPAVGGFVVVTGEIQDEYDALYVIDLSTRRLHAFMYDKTGKHLAFTSSRDLDRDFRNNTPAPAPAGGRP
ncbi:MAG: hypothetical protein AB7Q17_05610 [Phycisphaerae bacterium]